MKIGSKYRLGADALNITLYKSVNSKKPGGIRWQPIAYFSSVKNALNDLVDREVMEAGLKDLKTVVSKIDELYGLISRLENSSERAESCTGAEKTKKKGNVLGASENG